MRRGRGRSNQILVAFCVAGFALFNFPLLIIWDQDLTLFGLPFLPVALFVIWGGLIGVLAWVSEGDSEGRKPGPQPDNAQPRALRDGEENTGSRTRAGWRS